MRKEVSEMEYKKEFCLMVDPKTGNPRLVEPSEDPEQIVKDFLKQAKKNAWLALGHGPAGL